ncbi:hypothetical protein [Kitasatospora sp. DSM 101779]|uniref:hypothetical protein n=1 Tax=Kitasatospora sp. DSM 101779 TaxID=2853165 RepID=UPI0021D7FF02|nr:hypothetical protein [Kitasatospora sp. DSM 101779]MCU7822636.1 hypothetical protein [Kitasatospora sp. DSM 101779]
MNPEIACKELARMLTHIAEKYAQGRLGALLPDGDLEGLEPVRDHATLLSACRTVVGFAFVALAGWAGTVYGKPYGVEAPWSLVPAVMVALVAFPALRPSVPEIARSFLPGAK